MSVERLPVVGVMGASARADVERARALGRWLAGEGVHLLTGGGGGAMAEVTRAFSETAGRRGMALGVLPADAAEPRARTGYPNPWVEIAIHTHLHKLGDEGDDPLSRNHINVLSSDVVVALAGAEGTSSEVRLALRYGRPVVAHLASRDEIPRLPAEVLVEPELDGVCRFVRQALAARAADER